MRVLLAVIAAALCSCTFDSSGGRFEGDGGSPAADASADGGPITCTPGEATCDGRSVRTCNDAGDGFEPGGAICPFVCSLGACVSASNATDDVYQVCTSASPALTPPAGATIVITDGPMIACDPHCGDGTTKTISSGGRISQSGSVGLQWFCLGRVTIPAGIKVDATAVDPGILLFSDGPVALDGEIDISGSGGVTLVGGGAGPGGGRGGDSILEGDNGSGTCPGGGGARGGSSGDRSTGGGGGGGYAGGGGLGGSGVSPSENSTSLGGLGGNVCGAEELAPIFGGSGGGAGGNCDTPCGAGGGGGGGAIQIASRVSISIAGAISARGGAGGFTIINGGGGGGGSGGAILLESLSVDTTGAQLRVDGGDGGNSRAGSGGSGASGGAAGGGIGASGVSGGDGGAGGGGGGGRIRINSVDASGCAGTISPAAACTSGALPN